MKNLKHKLTSYRNVPLCIYFLYTLFVLLSLVAGPIEYSNLNIIVLIIFISAVAIMFSTGYVYGSRGAILYKQDGEKLYLEKKSYRLICVLLIYGAVSSLIHWVILFESGNDFSLQSIGSNYINAYTDYERGQSTVDAVYILNILDQAILTISIIFGFCYFRYLSNLLKILTFVVATSYFATNVLGSGKQKYLGDIVIFVVFSFLIYSARYKYKFNYKKIFTYTIVFSIITFVFLEIIRQRYVAVGIDLSVINRAAHPLMYWNEDSIIFTIFGNDYGFALGVFLSYFTNGLYGLYLSLITPFEWSYFVGNSYSLGRIVEIIIGSKDVVLEKTYPYRVGVEHGWGFDKWHSLFSWMASDITFFGVIIFSLFFGFVYGRVWRESINISNIFSGPLFIYFSMGVIFCYANNQLMHTLSGVIVLCSLMIGRLFTKFA